MPNRVTSPYSWLTAAVMPSTLTGGRVGVALTWVLVDGLPASVMNGISDSRWIAEKARF